MTLFALRDYRAIDAAPSADQNTDSRQAAKWNDKMRSDDSSLAAHRLVQSVNYDRPATIDPADSSNQTRDVEGRLFPNRNPNGLRQSARAIVECLPLGMDGDINDALRGNSCVAFRRHCAGRYSTLP